MTLLVLTAVTQYSPVCDIHFVHIHAVETVRPMGGNMAFIEAGIFGRTMKNRTRQCKPRRTDECEHWWNGNFQGKTKSSEKIYPSSTSSTTYPTRLGIESGPPRWEDGD
jgi:hypothetical protein